MKARSKGKGNESEAQDPIREKDAIIKRIAEENEEIEKAVGDLVYHTLPVIMLLRDVVGGDEELDVLKVRPSDQGTFCHAYNGVAEILRSLAVKMFDDYQKIEGAFAEVADKIKTLTKPAA